ncbi:hypothetical protein EI94DRAFT_1740503, partial [Lactarius quietus]
MGREGETWAQARAKRRSDQALSLDTPSGCWSEGAENSSVDAEERGVVIAVDRLRIAPIAVNATGNRTHDTQESLDICDVVWDFARKHLRTVESIGRKNGGVVLRSASREGYWLCLASKAQ